MKMASWSSVSEHLVNPIGMSDQLKWNNQQSHTTEINEKEVIYCIPLKRTIIFCPECGSRMNIKNYRKFKVIHNMIRDRNTSLIPKRENLIRKRINKTFK